MRSFYNPAGLAFAHGIQLSGSFVKPFPFFEHTIHSLTALSISLNGFGTLAISTYRFWRERQAITFETGPDIIAVDGEDFNFFKPTHWEIKLSYARRLNQQVAIGINISLLRIKLFDFDSSGPIPLGGESGKVKNYTGMFGFGFLFKNIFPKATWKPKLQHKSSFLNKYSVKHDDVGLSVGFSILNAGPKIKFIGDQKDNPPTIASLGLAFQAISSPLLSYLIATDFQKEIFESSLLDHIHLGNEIRVYNLFSIRSGYFLNIEHSNAALFTYGVGVQLKYFTLNIARYNRSLQSTWHFDGTVSWEIGK